MFATLNSMRTFFLTLHLYSVIEAISSFLRQWFGHRTNLILKRKALNTIFARMPWNGLLVLPVKSWAQGEVLIWDANRERMVLVGY